MSLTDAYSIVNAGSPGLYDATDANNGGAPGTVAEKVQGQFGPHREKAMALFSGMFSPTLDAPMRPVGRPDYSMNYKPGMQRPEPNPWRGLSPLEMTLASAGYKQDADAAPIANIWSAIQGRHMTTDEMAARDMEMKKSGGLLSGLFSMFGG
jgi:hypothetical protein